MVCVVRGEGGPLYSANRSVPAPNKYGNIVHRLGVDRIKFPAKDELEPPQKGVGPSMGSAKPRLRRFGPIFGRCTPCGPLVQDSRCPALVDPFALSNEPLLDVLRRQRCSVYFSCVFCVFSCYSRLVSLQSTIHQHS